MKQISAKAIQLAEQVIKSSKDADIFKQECRELKSKTQKLAAVLRDLGARAAGSEFYVRPAPLIINETEQVLDKALSLVLACCRNGLMKRVLTIIPAAAFRKALDLLDSSIKDVSWLLQTLFATNDQEGAFSFLLPFVSNNPILGFIWQYISILYNGSLDHKHDAVAKLLALAHDNHRCTKLIIQEEGAAPLMKFLKGGRVEDQIIAAKAIGILGCDSESVRCIIDAGVCLVFVKILKEGSMKAQAEVALAISKLVVNYSQCQDIFSKHKIVRLLIDHLAFETVEEHVQNVVIINKATSVFSMVMAKNRLNMRKEIEGCYDERPKHTRPVCETNISLADANLIGRDLEDPNTKAHMKAMAARALWQLAKSNPSICRSINESRAMMCFSVLLEKGSQDVRYHSACALMEITSVAEQDKDLRRSFFRPSSPVCKAVIDQLVNIIEHQDSDLLIPCIRAIGNLAKIFRVTETKIIAPIIVLLCKNKATFSVGSLRPKSTVNTRLRGYSFERLIRTLGEKEAEICREALRTLTKFVCKENHLHQDHSQTIIDVGGLAPIIQLVDSGDEIVQKPALILLCYIVIYASSVGEQAERAFNAIAWASKYADFTQDEMLHTLLHEAYSRLELYHLSD